MRLIEAFHKIDQLGDVAIQTRDVAGILNIDSAHASQLLRRMSKENLLVPLVKGLWGFPKKMDIFLLPRYLSAPFPCYISLHTALYSHDMITQIPSVIYAVTLARTKKIRTPLADVSFHHLDPAFFFGYEVDPKSGVALATPEKALLDIFYFSSAKSKLFSDLVEVELPKKFNLKTLREMIDKIPSKQRQEMVRSRFEAWYKRAHLSIEVDDKKMDV